MTTRLAIFLMAAIIGFFVLDHYVLHLDALVFLSRKGIDLIQTIAFWR
ncbi:hypothetical protein [Pseudooctadecabacter jejudonensis]|uniref:Glyceraldehyde-3-phosphate dehydrogenase n=1 Tax=Pseudooctadecabacter jejudonensis TaxID=1391910 RepID=A0A1Y5R9A8_9RHOB|nr:hypothetical protein [Pseudooctadecabacter jejudonensis]SLN12152.1 hypothetical protein PSJ8397_00149 [Pseudooctadecabacter jejudonensis]